MNKERERERERIFENRGLRRKFLLLWVPLNNIYANLAVIIHA
jgi:hypothetical protein